MKSIVTFVCLHGAGKSRIAAALFNAAAPPGWRASSAGVQPQEQPSEHATALLEGEAAAAWLDHSPPNSLGGSPAGMVVGIDCEIPDARRWMLTHEWPAPEVREELRTLVQDLTVELADPGRPDPTPQ